MGLFKKRPEEPGEVERLQAEIAAMSARLDAADAAKEQLGTQLRSLSEKVEAIPPPDAVPPPPPMIDQGELDMLRARVKRVNDRIAEVEGSVNERIDASVSVAHELDEQMRAIGERLEQTPAAPTLSTPPPPPPDGGAVGGSAIDAAELDDLRSETKELRERLDQVDAVVAQRFSALDARITAISTELANQISELSTDLDTIARSAPPADGDLDELRDAQERLASEQARYQIAFRQDLADLADRLRRP